MLLRIPIMAGLITLLLTVGCSTVDSRIKEHADFFSTLPTDQQARLQAGQIAIGDTKDMVYIALGEPDTILTRTDQTGTVFDIWSYSGVFYTRDTRWHTPSPFRHRRYKGHDVFYSGPEYVDVQHEYERLRIEFDAGKVKAFDQTQK